MAMTFIDWCPTCRTQRWCSRVDVCQQDAARAHAIALYGHEGIPLHYDGCPYTADPSADCTCGPDHLAAVWKARWHVATRERAEARAERDAALEDTKDYLDLVAQRDAARAEVAALTQQHENDQQDFALASAAFSLQFSLQRERNWNVAIALVEQYRDDPRAPIPWDACGEAILARLKGDPA